MNTNVLLKFYLPRLGMLLCTLMLLHNTYDVLNARLAPDSMEQDFHRVTSSKWLGMHVWPVLPWLMLALLQVSTWFRKKFIRLHRWGGRALLAISFYMTVGYVMMFVAGETLAGDKEFCIDWRRPEKFFTFRAACITFTFWWAYCMVQAYRKASKGTIYLHRYYAYQFLATGFGVGVARYFIAFFIAFNYLIPGDVEMPKTTQDLIMGYCVWAGFAFNVLLVELYARTGYLGPLETRRKTSDKRL